MATIKHTFPESTNRSQTRSLTIPNLKSVISVTVNTGNVSYTVNGETITFNMSGGAYSRRVQTGGSYTPADSFTATDSRTSSSNNLPSSIPYNSNGYSGTLYGQGVVQTVVSGSAGGSKTVTDTRSVTYSGDSGCTDAEDQARRRLLSSISYSDEQGYSGTLRLSSSSTSCTRSGRSHDDYVWYGTAIGTYSGTVTKPDTRVYSFSQTYRGTVTKPESDTRTYAYYYQYSISVQYTDNSIPTLNLNSPTNDQTLSEGDKLLIEGTASDPDIGNVITVKYKINDGTARAAGSGVSDGSSTVSFTRTLTYSNKRLREGSTVVTGTDLAENTDHVLTVWAEDDQGGKSAEVTRTFRVIHNRAPVISGTDENLGTIMSPPIQTYTIADPEGNNFTVTERINGTVIRSFLGTAGQEETITVPHDQWIRLDLDIPHTLTVEATDTQGMTSTRTLTFTRTETHIEFKLNFDNPAVAAHFTLDGRPERILVTLDRYLPPGASIESVKVCNNALDAEPTWEDATAAVTAGRGYLFTNQTKTADNWRIDIWVVIAKGSATERVRLDGLGGAFD